MNIIPNIVEILTPFKLATDLAQAKTEVTASIVLLVIRGLKVPLESLHVKFNSRLTTALKSSLEKRMSKYEQHEFFKVAAALDLRWKVGWCVQKESAQIKNIILDKARFLLQQSGSPADSAIESLDSEASPPGKRSKLFELMDS